MTIETPRKPDLWSLLLTFQGANTTLQFNFFGCVTCRKMYDRLKEGRAGKLVVEIEDDYSSRSDIDCSTLATVTMSETSKIMDFSADQGILQAHAQLKFRNRVNGDPTLKFLANALQPPPAPGSPLMRT